MYRVLYYCVPVLIVGMNCLFYKREWRQAGGRQPGLMNHAQPVPDSLPSPSVSGSRKRKNTSQSIPSLPLKVPSPAMHSQPVGASMQPSVSAVKHGPSGTKGKQPKPVCQISTFLRHEFMFDHSAILNIFGYEYDYNPLFNHWL